MKNIDISKLFHDNGKHIYFKINGVIYEGVRGQRTFSSVRSLKSSLNFKYTWTYEREFKNDFPKCKDFINYIISQGQILTL